MSFAQWNELALNQAALLGVSKDEIEELVRTRVKDGIFKPFGKRGRSTTSVKLGNGRFYDVEFVYTGPANLWIQMVNECPEDLG